MDSQASYLRALLPSLPTEIARKVRALCSSTTDSSAEHTLETLIRFVTGADCGPNASTDVHTQWSEKQQAAVEIFTSLNGKSPSSSSKRPREEDTLNVSQATKKQKPSEPQASGTELADDLPVYTLHAVSASSPVRKKVNIAIHKCSIRFIHPTSNSTECSISLSTLTRAFLVPTRGKTKAHWTIVILPNDTSDRGNKQANASAANQQVIFGLDATTSGPLMTTDHTASAPSSTTLPKGSETYGTLQTFLGHLGIKIIEPKPSGFKSACTGITSGVSASEGGIPGVEAYRGAKVGSLWFTNEGILWGESKPCEFWGVDDLIPRSEAVRVVGGASGQRTLTVVLTRKSDDEPGHAEQGEDIGVESEFGMVDARERPGIEAWTRAHRHLFGKKQAPTSKSGGGPPAQALVDSDEEDDNFEPDSESDGGSATSSSENEDDASGEEDVEGSEAEEDDDEIQELDPQHHPLLQPGAMPKISRAVIDMVAGMVEEDMMSGSMSDDAPGEDDMEQDELED